MSDSENPRASDDGGISRRGIVKLVGATAAAAVAFGVDIPGLRLSEAFAQAGPIDVGGGDIGVLNYAYALEQLEAAFYTQVIATPGGRQHLSFGHRAVERAVPRPHSANAPHLGGVPGFAPFIAG